MTYVVILPIIQVRRKVGTFQGNKFTIFQSCVQFLIIDSSDAYHSSTVFAGDNAAAHRILDIGA